MKKRLLSILKAVGLYHPLQSRYRFVLLELKKRRLRREYAAHKGSGYTCNYCGKRYTKFAPWYPDSVDQPALERHAVVAGYGENVYCPNCMSTARERLLIARLSEMQLNGKKILHLAPEEKIFNILVSVANVTAADITPGFFSYWNPAIEFADVTRLPYPHQCFDIVIGNHIMEHIPDDRTAMREIYRVLKPGGTAILQIPFSTVNDCTTEDPSIDNPTKQSELFGQKDHVRIYALRDYIHRLKTAGFNVRYIPHESLTQYYIYAIQPFEGFIWIQKT